MEPTHFRIIPVVVIHEARRAGDLADALTAGGLPVAEVTLRTPAALDAIRVLADDPRLLVGAGTVLSAAQVDSAAGAGAKFVVSPGFNRAVVDRARERGLAVVPGAVTPSEIMAALDAGITTCKFFPANVNGGIDALRAFGSVFSQVSFVPTGGVSAANVADYLALSNVSAVGGSWMVPPAAIDSGDFDLVVERCRAAVALASKEK